MAAVYNHMRIRSTAGKPRIVADSNITITNDCTVSTKKVAPEIATQDTTCKGKWRYRSNIHGCTKAEHTSHTYRHNSAT